MDAACPYVRVKSSKFRFLLSPATARRAAVNSDDPIVRGRTCDLADTT